MSDETINNPASTIAFSFGDPEPVLEGRDILDYLEAANMGEYFETPISFDGLAKSLRASIHHSSPINVKANILASIYRPHPMLTASTLKTIALNYLVFGNAYPEMVRARSGRTMRIEAAPAKYIRRGTNLVDYWFVRGWKDMQKLRRGSVLHMIEPDINQEIYGLPQYLSALQSAWLNEAATLFRRKYYKNGSHAGFILYLTDAAQNTEDVDNLRKALKEAKGPGNFRNLFMYSPNGKKDGLQLIPVSEVAAKDEFFNIKAVTRDDMLAAHRVPPQLLGIVPTNTSGFGDAETAARVFVANELKPLQAEMQQINRWVGEEVVTFNEYQLPTKSAA